MRILVLGGLSERGLKFIETLPIRDYLIVVDDLKNNKDKNLMKLLIQRKPLSFLVEEKSLLFCTGKSLDFPCLKIQIFNICNTSSACPFAVTLYQTYEKSSIFMPYYFSLS